MLPSISNLERRDETHLVTLSALTCTWPHSASRICWGVTMWPALARSSRSASSSFGGRCIGVSPRKRAVRFKPEPGKGECDPTRFTGGIRQVGGAREIRRRQVHSIQRSSSKYQPGPGGIPAAFQIRQGTHHPSGPFFGQCREKETQRAPYSSSYAGTQIILGNTEIIYVDHFEGE